MNVQPDIELTRPERAITVDNSTLTTGTDSSAKHATTRALLTALASGAKSRLAGLIIDWVQAHTSGVRPLVITLADHERSATVIATDDENKQLLARRIDLSYKSSIYDVMRASYHGRVFLTRDPDSLRPWCEMFGEEFDAKTCVEVAGNLLQSSVIVVLSDQASTEEARDALATLATLLNVMAGTGAVKQARLHKFIARAKQEWEQSADALSELVCLLDRTGRVLRVNRTLERWELGDVTEVQGKDMHAVLHPRCARTPCHLEELLDTAWNHVTENQARYFRFTDPQLGKTLRVGLQPMPADGELDSGDAFAVLVAADFTELHEAQEELRQLNERLEQRVTKRTLELQERNRLLRDQIARREKAERQLQRSRDELALLSEQLMRTQESERRRIALELHDSVGQSLGAAKYSLERAAELTRNATLGNAEEAIEASVVAVQRAIDEARSIAMALRPSLLDDMGVVSALSWFCREFGETYVDLAVIVDCPVRDEDVPARLATPVFRIVQEALNNIVKHAHAKNALVHLGTSPDRRKLLLEIRDDGVGFSVRDVKPNGSSGLGIIGMRERATITGGKFTLVSGEDISTQVRVEWELSEADTAGG